jgi:hypothetical protein
MPDYSFLTLSPPEFEDLTRSLLQKQLNLTLESFTSGRDNGIDLRYTKSNRNDLIIQCKRYNEFKTLISNLRKEVSKVKKLNPKRYILTTSVGLTPNQKEEIKNIFYPYLKTTMDIFGRDDLNNLIGLFPEIEKQNFKLWLSSTNILEKFLHNRIVNQSIFEVDKIEETLKIYVENESYYLSLNIIKENRYVIISGIPGIGKTTLARILVYYFLSNGFEEFIYISDSIKEGYDMYKDGVKQIFLFDDFLGRNFLEKKLSNNEEKRIIQLIERVNKSNDKILLLTTREYILAQAKQQYDIFENPSLEFAKCIIDLSQYTKIVRAKILYNHIYFSSIPQEYINNLLKNKNYNLIIQHKNYNPRIIQTITNKDIWKTIAPNTFFRSILKYFDYPESIWKHVFENQISNLSQCILGILMTVGTPIYLSDLKLSISNFAKKHSAKYGIKYSELELKKSLRELENTFIITKANTRDEIIVEYQNPSVQDFLVHYFREIPDFIINIIEGAVFFNQLFDIFTTSETEKIHKIFTGNKNTITLTKDLNDSILKKLLLDYHSLNYPNLPPYEKSIKEKWIYLTNSEYYKLEKILEYFPIDIYPQIKDFTSKIFSLLITPQNLLGNDFDRYINLLIIFKDEYILDKSKVISNYFSKISELNQVIQFKRFKEIFNEEYLEFIEKSEDFIEKLQELIYNEAYDAENDEDSLENTLRGIEGVAREFGIDYYDARAIIKAKIEKTKKLNKIIEKEPLKIDIDYSERNILYNKDIENIINDIFDSLSNISLRE